MAFFDEGDEPPTRAARPRRPGGPRAGGGGGAGVADPQTLRNRRIVAGIFAVVIAILLFVLIDGCLDRRAENALKDYNRDVGSIIRQSDRDVGRSFFDLLGQGGQSPVELESQINQLRVTAERQVDTAEDFDTPDEMKTAQRNLLLALNMRASGLEKIASEVRTALADEGGDAPAEAVDQIAAQMQQFLASDVTYDAWVRPFIEETLNEKEIGGQTITDSQFLPSLDWLQPDFVGDRLGAEGGTTQGGEPAPGLHGHGLTSVAVGDLTLQPGQTANRIPAGSNVVFTVTFANQGENEESDVLVRIRIRGDGDTITAQKRVDQTQPGQEAEVSIPLSQAPPIGTPVTIEVSVPKVPGEEKTDNNSQEYTAIFTR